MLDRKDRQILQSLQHNGRISNADLASEVNLSPTPCLRRVRKLEQEGYIRQYTALLNNEKLGMNITALAFIKLEKNTADNARLFEQAIRRFARIQECSSITGEHDYLVKVLAESLPDYDRFIKEELANIPQVTGIESTIILNQIDTATADI